MSQTALKIQFEARIPTGPYTFPEKAPKTGIIPAYPTCLNRKKLQSEKGLIGKVQPEYAVYMTCVKLLVLPYLEH